MPVRAIGARAILDFPDEVNFGTCPVKVKRMNLKFKLVMHCTSIDLVCSLLPLWVFDHGLSCLNTNCAIYDIARRNVLIITIRGLKG